MATGRFDDAMARNNDSANATPLARTRPGSAGGIGRCGPRSAANSGASAVAIPALSPVVWSTHKLLSGPSLDTEDTQNAELDEGRFEDIEVSR